MLVFVRYPMLIPAGSVRRDASKLNYNRAFLWRVQSSVTSIPRKQQSTYVVKKQYLLAKSCQAQNCGLNSYNTLHIRDTENC